MKTDIKKILKASVVIALVVVGTVFYLYPSTARADPPITPGTIRVFKGDVNVTLTATDDWSGVNWTKIEIWYTDDINADPVQWVEYLPERYYIDGEIITLSTAGWYQTHYYSQDYAENTETTKHDTIRVIQDDKPPSTEIHYDGDEVTPT